MALSTTPTRSHTRAWNDNRYVYAVMSRRSGGVSLGINLNPDKICNFGCVYCEVDRTVTPTVRRVSLDILRAELRALLADVNAGQLAAHPAFSHAPAAARLLRDVAFSGDGEPTTSRQFPAAARIVVEELAMTGLTGIKIVVITNATMFGRTAVQETFAYLDQHHGEIWAKLDAGTDSYYRTIDATSIPFQRVVANILLAATVRPLVIQSMFARLHEKAPSDAEILAYIGRLRSLLEQGGQIARVQAYTVSRRPAEPYVAALTDTEMIALGERIAGETGLLTEVYSPTERLPLSVEMGGVTRHA